MTTYGVLIQNKVAAQDIDALNRSALSGADVPNGGIFRLDSQSGSSGMSEVWAVTYASGSETLLGDLWMAYSPEVVVTVSGNSQYKGIDPDPRNFLNLAGKVFDAFQPQKGDVLTLTTDAFDTAYSASTVYANPSGSSTFKMIFEATQAAAGALSFKWLATTYISLATGAINSQRVVAYKVVCLDN